MPASQLVRPKLHRSERLGEVLCHADLISSAQIQVALNDQRHQCNLRLGKILALRGWLKSETADFFVEEWPILLARTNRQRLGDYFRQAALLTHGQIDDILAEQQHTGFKFGAVAVLHGWIRPQTLAFFLEHLFPEQVCAAYFMER